MANLIPADSFDDVPELATTDPVQGGPGGKSNEQPQKILNRTHWLKKRIRGEVVLDVDDGTASPVVLTAAQAAAPILVVMTSGFRTTPISVQYPAASSADDASTRLVMSELPGVAVTITDDDGHSAPSGLNATDGATVLLSPRGIFFLGTWTLS